MVSKYNQKIIQIQHRLYLVRTIIIIGVILVKIRKFIPENASYQRYFTEVSFDTSEGNQLSFFQNDYRIYSYSFRRNYSFFNLKIQRSQYIRPKVTVHKCGEAIQGRKQHEEIQYFSKLFGDFMRHIRN